VAAQAVVAAQVATVVVAVAAGGPAAGVVSEALEVGYEAEAERAPVTWASEAMGAASAAARRRKKR
jgi:hypothetical protein